MDFDGTYIGLTNPGQNKDTAGDLTLDASTSASDSHSSASQDSDAHDTLPMLVSSKKNLAVDHKEPIQIFIKIKQFADEACVTNNQPLYKLHGDTGVSVLPPASSIYAKNKQLKMKLAEAVEEAKSRQEKAEADKLARKNIYYKIFHIILFSYS